YFEFEREAVNESSIFNYGFIISITYEELLNQLPYHRSVVLKSVHSLVKTWEDYENKGYQDRIRLEEFLFKVLSSDPKPEYNWTRHFKKWIAKTGQNVMKMKVSDMTIIHHMMLPSSQKSENVRSVYLGGEKLDINWERRNERVVLNALQALLGEPGRKNYASLLRTAAPVQFTSKDKEHTSIMLSPIAMAAALGYWGIYKFLTAHLNYFEEFVPWFHTSDGIPISSLLNQGLKSFASSKLANETWIQNERAVSSFATSKDMSSISHAHNRNQNWQSIILENSERRRELIRKQFEELTMRILKHHSSSNRSPTQAVKQTAESLFDSIEKKPRDQEKAFRTMDLRGFNELPPHARMIFLKVPIRILATEIQEFQKASSLEELIAWMGVEGIYSVDLRPFVKEYLKSIFPKI
ncbi:MAG: hypothetical protein HRU09_13405, partial [Oligoflexales bacterium]|nr:hypothetical protein [Oligoflexales bacterium]